MLSIPVSPRLMKAKIGVISFNTMLKKIIADYICGAFENWSCKIKDI